LRSWPAAVVEKRFQGKQPVTTVRLTADGRDALETYWQRFDRVRQGLRKLKPVRST
jgi:hypothetical protein